MKREIIITFLCAFLLGGLLAFTMFGCSFKKTNESFTGGEAKDTSGTTLSAEEEELFKDIQSGQLNDQDIMKMVESGKITEKMVEKFLAYLDTMPDPDTEAPASEVTKASSGSANRTSSSARSKQEEGFDVEAFTGSMYAPVK